VSAGNRDDADPGAARAEGQVSPERPTAVRKRPGRLWLFFYGRKRRGFPGLLVGLIVLVLALGSVYRLPGGADLSRWWEPVSIGVLALLILGSLALAVIRPRRRRRGGR
jgi:hypothetical protein